MTDRAAEAGVEEAAGKLTKFVAAKISEYLPGDMDLPDDDAQAIREFLVRLLAAERAKYVAVLEECRPYVSAHGMNDLLARIDALKGGT